MNVKVTIETNGLVEAINKLADALKGNGFVKAAVEEVPFEEKPEQVKPEPDVKEAPKPEPVKPEAPAEEPKKVTRDEIFQRCVVLMNGGKQLELTNLLNQFGVASLPQLPSDKLDMFWKALDTLEA